MRPKVRGLAQHGDRLAGWRRVTQQGVILYVMDDATCPGGPHLLLNVHKNLMSYVMQGRHGLVLEETHAFSRRDLGNSL
jgi:hypothetical protein